MSISDLPATLVEPWPAAAQAPRSPYHLSEQQIRFFDENGYLVLRNWLPRDLLERLRAAGQAWIEDGLRAGKDDPHYEDYMFAKRPYGQVMFRVNYLHDKGQSASLELLGCPQVLAVAESLCGPNFVPTYEFMVFKQEGDGEKIPWHQDAVHPRRYRIFNYDLYLDHSRIGAGALRVIPRSQTGPRDVCRIAETYGWDAPGVIQVEMAPGDVLLHDVMVVHGSEHCEGNALRRTVYYEFRAAEQIVAEGPWDRAWVERRLRLLTPALQRYRLADPGADQFQWRISDEFRPPAGDDEEAELKVAHVVHMGGSYCSAGSVLPAPGRGTA